MNINKIVALIFGIIIFSVLNTHSQSLEIDGSLKILDGTQGTGKILTSDASGNAQWENLSLLSNPNHGDMLYWDGSAWQSVPAGTQGQLLTYCNNQPAWGPCVANNLTSQMHQIQQTWSQETNYDRPVHIQVPTSGTSPFPVVILLHGNGGTGNPMLNYLSSDVIKVAPDGYLKSWNIKNEMSKAPDVEFISEIITYLKTFSNVDPNNISILGISNGSGMVNKLLVELPAGKFQNGVCIVSPKTDSLYHDGAFYYDPTGGNSYSTTIVPPTDKRIFTVSGTLDHLIPYKEG